MTWGLLLLLLMASGRRSEGILTMMPQRRAGEGETQGEDEHRRDGAPVGQRAPHVPADSNQQPALHLTESAPPAQHGSTIAPDGSSRVRRV